jgi:hypothetical protein
MKCRMRDLAENLLPFLLPGFGALLGVLVLLRDRFPPLGFHILGWVVVRRALLAWRACAVGLMLLAQLVLAPLAGPAVGTWLGLRAAAPAPTVQDSEDDIATLERRQASLVDLRVLTHEHLDEARTAYDLGDLPEDEYQSRVSRLTDLRRDCDAQNEKLERQLDQLRRAREAQQRSNEQRTRSRLCVARTWEGLLMLSLCLGLALAWTIISGVRTGAQLPDAEPALDQSV